MKKLTTNNIIAMATVLHLISLRRSAAWLDPTYKRSTISFTTH